MKYIIYALCSICVACLVAVAQDAGGSRPSDIGDSRARFEAERLRRLKGEKETPSPSQTPAAAPATPAKGATSVEDYIIGPEDVLQISVWREQDLTTRATVRPDGKIGLPLLSDVQASGLTTKQLQDSITEGLAKFVEDPRVSVIVSEIHSQMVHIIGAVGRQGGYPLGGPLTIVELLARAGGLSEFSKSDQIAIIRTEGGKTQRFSFNYKTFVSGSNLKQNILLRHGDVIIIP